MVTAEMLNQNTKQLEQQTDDKSILTKVSNCDH